HEEDKRLINGIKKVLVKELKKKPISDYHIAYDSFGEGLEPLYFWTLDFMRDKDPSGLGLDVVKTGEGFEASTGSGYFGEMGSRASVMQDRAMKIMQTINAVVKSIINLIYDLKEFEIRLGSYEDLKSKDINKKDAGRLALKGVWMDQVDIKRGRGSVNMMAQQLQFVTLRDAFMAIDSEKDVEELDLNKRVKNILSRKINEYLKWEKESESELRKRFNIEQAYLKSQVDSLKLYTKWLAPYLKAAQKLGMREFNTADIVATFNNMQMELSLFGKREIKPEDVHESFRKLKLGKKFYACLEITFNFRTVPQAARTQTGTHYIHTGRTDIHFKSFAFDEDDVKLLEEQELFEDMELVENLTNVSLKELEVDLDYFLRKTIEKCPKCGNEIKNDKCSACGYSKKKKSMIGEFKVPFEGVTKGFKEIFEPIRMGVGGFRPRKEVGGFMARELKKAAEGKAKGLCFTAYEIYKKAHGMLTW
ncbi:MAG: zinc ribbon domain-containing protein, partial [Nanoarchaeota archaeon]